MHRPPGMYPNAYGKAPPPMECIGVPLQLRPPAIMHLPPGHPAAEVGIHIFFIRSLDAYFAIMTICIRGCLSFSLIWCWIKLKHFFSSEIPFW